MENEVVVNPIEFGIEEKKVGELMGNLPQLKTEREALVSAYDAVLKLDLDDPNTAKQAREIRLKIRDNRTKGIEVWHNNTKEVFLRFGQFVDAVKRHEIEVNQRMEANLKEIEKHAEIQENKRLDELEKVRLEKLEPFKEFVPFGVNVRTISDADFDMIFNGAKLQFDAKIEAERLEVERVEQERIENEKRLAEEKRIEAERIEAQRIENERLKKEAEEKARELELERQKAEAERKRLAEIQAKKDAEQAEILRKEQAEKSRLEAELKAKQEADQKAEAERIAKEEAERLEAEKIAKAPVKKQMTFWIDLFNAPEKTVENDLSDEILAKFESFKKWAKGEIAKL